MGHSNSFETPILLITFNRLETTKKVFKKIREQKPRKLYLASDGARDQLSGEEYKVNVIRDYLKSNVDWNCEVHTLFHEKNLGCKFAPQNAITWFFENEEKGIILEDDCLPSDSFFHYCQTLLNHFEEDLRIFTISGFTFEQDKIKCQDSYFFSTFPMIWGWATWRNRWKKNLLAISNYNDINKDSLVENFSDNQAVNKAIINNSKLSIENKIDAWDYLWIYTNFLNNALSIVPAKSLINNIGFGEDATHTKAVRTFKNPQNNEMNEELSHPQAIVPNRKYDNYIFKEVYNWKSFNEKITNPFHLLKVIKARIT